MRSVCFHNLQADISQSLMNKIYHHNLSKAALLVLGFACATFTGWAQETEEEVFELSPFTVDAAGDEGYYASQTMAGGTSW